MQSWATNFPKGPHVGLLWRVALVRVPFKWSLVCSPIICASVGFLKPHSGSLNYLDSLFQEEVGTYSEAFGSAVVCVTFLLQTRVQSRK